VGRLTKELEKHFGAPQDIEWLSPGTGPFPNVMLLQARQAVVIKKTASDSVVDMMLACSDVEQERTCGRRRNCKK